MVTSLYPAPGSATLPNDYDVIDCDIHNVVPSLHTLFPYLPDFWKEQAKLTGFSGATDNWYPRSAAISSLPGPRPPQNGTAGSSLALLQEQVLDPWKVRIGILQCAYSVEGVHNPDAAVALSRAVNDWQIEQWLDKDARLRASVVVPSQHPELAAQEIERVGPHPGFVQVLLPVRSAVPYGNRRFHPLYEAALRQDLVIGIHSGGAPGNPPSAAGWFPTYIEDYTNMASVFQTQLLSLICEGVFDRFPELRVVLIESGCTWLPSLLWRIDKEWKGLRREVPWVRRLPSEYVREHVRMTIQPFDGPSNGQQVLEIVEHMGSEDLLMFATDYPHWHFDSPEEALPPCLPESLVRRIMAENAQAFYQF